VTRRVIVVGGGIAGVAAALDLAAAGIDTTLLERRKQLGGRATSFRDPDEGRLLDNGQHVVLGACTELLSFLEALGVSDRIAWRRAIHLRAPGGERATIAPFPLLGPLAFLPSLVTMGWLTASERLAAIRVARRLRKWDFHREAGERETFAEFLSRLEQPPRVVSRLWGPIVTSALNELPERASARASLAMLRDAFVAGPEAGRMGVPRVPLSEIFDVAARAALERAGVEVLVGTEAAGVVRANGHVRLSEGTDVRADAIVLAVPLPAVAKLLPAADLDAAGLRPALEIGVSPIVSAHFFFDPEVAIPEGELALVETTAQWVFDRHAASGRDDDRGHLAVVVSAARSLVDAPREEIEDRLLDDVRAAVPSARDRRPRRVVVVKERAATFAAVPGAEERRPPETTHLERLFLAGDACATGWPATMEGAVRSGRAAARAVRGAVSAAALS